MTSADFSQFVVTARLLYLKPRLRDLPSYGRTLSGLYPLGLLSAVRIVIGLLLPLQHYPCLPAFYQVLVHRANRLPPASFRFHLTMDTLALGYVIPAIRAHSGLAPVRQCSCRAYRQRDAYHQASVPYLLDCLSSDRLHHTTTHGLCRHLRLVFLLVADDTFGSEEHSGN